MYYIGNITGDIYIRMLNHLGKSCDSFHLVEPIGDSSEFPSDLPPVKQKLNEYLCEKRRVTSWAGTKIKVREEKRKAIEHIYRCCKSSVDKLLAYDSFFDIENQIDIAFLKENQCVIFTISHERIVMTEESFWGDFFDNTDCALSQSQKF